MIRVKPCAFCGSDKILTDGVSTYAADGTFARQVMCLNCGAVGPVAIKGVKQAVQLWNKRALVEGDEK